MDKLENKEIINFGKDPLGKFAQQDKNKQEKTKILDEQLVGFNHSDNKFSEMSKKQLQCLQRPRKINFNLDLPSDPSKFHNLNEPKSPLPIQKSPKANTGIYQYDTTKTNLDIDKDKEILIQKGLNQDFILEGEEFLVSNMVSLKQDERFFDGVLILTNYKIVFLPIIIDREKKEEIERQFERDSYFHIPLGYLLKIQRTSSEKKGNNYSQIELFTKDFREFIFRYSEKHSSKSLEFLTSVQRWAYPGPDLKENLFAFKYFKFNKDLELKQNGWKVYNIQQEFKRQNITYDVKNIEYDEQIEKNTFQKDYFYKYVDNRNGKICKSYPEYFIVPGKIDDQRIREYAKFRSNNRMPAMTYAYQHSAQDKQQTSTNKNFSTLWRSSQCCSGIQFMHDSSNRSYDDERFLRLIGDPTERISLDTVDIYDARPKIAAVGNQFQGKGFENIEHYKNCTLEFLNIENIHKVRDSMKVILKTISGEPQKFLTNVAKSEYLEYIGSIIQGAKKVAHSLSIKCKNVLVHCSDGWDRTSQLCGLAQILLDPYFRTIEGFIVLVEKDWISFGHQFAIRHGVGDQKHNDEQRSPIFLQYLDCVHQILNQFPLSFEYNQIFLIEIAQHIYSCLFGTMLCNHVQEQLDTKVREQTISLWSYLLSNKDKYINPFYLEVDVVKKLEPSVEYESIKLWKFFMYYVPGYKDSYNIYQDCIFTEDNIIMAHKYQKLKFEQVVNQNKQVNKELIEAENKIKELQLQLAQQSKKYNIEAEMKPVVLTLPVAQDQPPKSKDPFLMVTKAEEQIKEEAVVSQVELEVIESPVELVVAESPVELVTKAEEQIKEEVQEPPVEHTQLQELNHVEEVAESQVELEVIESLVELVVVESPVVAESPLELVTMAEKQIKEDVQESPVEHIQLQELNHVQYEQEHTNTINEEIQKNDLEIKNQKDEQKNYQENICQ